MHRLFNIQTIEKALGGFLESFPQINDTLAMRREDFTPIMINNILEAYTFLNDLLKQKMDLFTPAGLHALLEMNHLVLCGSDQETRSQYYHHLQETRKSFVKKIKPIKDWVLEKKESTEPYKLATGFYSRMLSQPQLFLEGNHRTGNILLNYLLISKGAAPYIASAADAKLYLDISGDIKFTDKDRALDNTIKMPGHRKRFQEFLAAYTKDEFLC
ncbi:MAG: hypothetical protein GW949_03735 [Spirochaetales bacterium]|nr:hypothetical protein [Spirochaetales bacterium]